MKCIKKKREDHICGKTFLLTIKKIKCVAIKHEIHVTEYSNLKSHCCKNQNLTIYICHNSHYRTLMTLHFSMYNWTEDLWRSEVLCCCWNKKLSWQNFEALYNLHILAVEKSVQLMIWNKWQHAKKWYLCTGLNMNVSKQSWYFYFQCTF